MDRRSPTTTRNERRRRNRVQPLYLNSSWSRPNAACMCVWVYSVQHTVQVEDFYTYSIIQGIFFFNILLLLLLLLLVVLHILSSRSTWHSFDTLDMMHYYYAMQSFQIIKRRMEKKSKKTHTRTTTNERERARMCESERQMYQKSADRKWREREYAYKMCWRESEREMIHRWGDGEEAVASSGVNKTTQTS